MASKIAEPKDWKELAFLYKIAEKHEIDPRNFQARVIEGHRYIFVDAAKGSGAISTNCTAKAKEGKLVFLTCDVLDANTSNLYSLESVTFERLWMPLAMWLKFKKNEGKITPQDLREDFIKYWKYMQHTCPCHKEALTQLHEKMRTYEGYSGSKPDLKFIDFFFCTEELLNKDGFFGPPKEWLSLLRYIACVSHEDLKAFCSEEEYSVILDALQNPADEAMAEKFHAIGMKKRVDLYVKKLFKVSAVAPEELACIALIPPTYFQSFLEEVAGKKADRGDEKKS